MPPSIFSRCCGSPRTFDGVLALVGGFSLHLTLGTLYCFGNLNTYITSYLRKNVHPGISYNDMVWVPTLATVSQGLCMTLSGHLEERIGVQMTIALGCLIMVSGVLLTSLAVQFSAVAVVFTYGCMFGTGTALAYAPPLGVAMKWFPKSKGLVNGVIVGGFGLGAFIFNQIQTAYLNPANHKLDDHGEFFTDNKILNRVPSLFLLLGALYAVIQCLAVFLIRSPPETDLVSMLPLVTDGSEDPELEEEEEEEVIDHLRQHGVVNPEEEASLLAQDVDGDEELDLNISSNGIGRRLPSSRQQHSSHRSVQRVTESRLENVRPGQMIRTKEFGVLWATFFLNTQAIGYTNAMYKAYGQTYISDDHFLSVVGAVAAVFNAGGRVFWGNLSDAYGYRTCMGIASMGLGVFFFTFRFIEFGGKPLFALWIWGIFFCFCANFVLLPTATAQSFGTKYSSKNYGLVMMGQAFSAPISAIVTEFVNPAVGWFGMFCLIGTCAVGCSLMNILAFPKNPNPKQILNRLENPSPSML